MKRKKKAARKRKLTRKRTRIYEHELAASLAVVLTILIIFLAVYFFTGEGIPIDIEIQKNIDEFTASDFFEPEAVSGFQDKTMIWFSDLRELSMGKEITVNVLAVDNTNKEDHDGGKIRLENAEITSMNQVDWEQNCTTNESSSYECIKAGITEVQWFNSVFSDQDSFRFTVKFSKNSVLILEETGGMECGPYADYPKESSSLPCAAEKTFVGKHTVSALGGFPVKIPLEI